MFCGRRLRVEGFGHFFRAQGWTSPVLRGCGKISDLLASHPVWTDVNTEAVLMNLPSALWHVTLNGSQRVTVWYLHGSSQHAGHSPTSFKDTNAWLVSLSSQCSFGLVSSWLPCVKASACEFQTYCVFYLTINYARNVQTHRPTRRTPSSHFLISHSWMLQLIKVVRDAVIAFLLYISIA